MRTNMLENIYHENILLNIMNMLTLSVKYCVRLGYLGHVNRVKSVKVIIFSE